MTVFFRWDEVSRDCTHDDAAATPRLAGGPIRGPQLGSGCGSSCGVTSTGAPQQPADVGLSTRCVCTETRRPGPGSACSPEPCERAQAAWARSLSQAGSPTWPETSLPEPCEGRPRGRPWDSVLVIVVPMPRMPVNAVHGVDMVTVLELLMTAVVAVGVLLDEVLGVFFGTSHGMSSVRRHPDPTWIVQGAPAAGLDATPRLVREQSRACHQPPPADPPDRSRCVPFCHVDTQRTPRETHPESRPTRRNRRTRRPPHSKRSAGVLIAP